MLASCMKSDKSGEPQGTEQLNKVPPRAEKTLGGASYSAIWLSVYWKAFSLKPLPPMARSFMYSGTGLPRYLST